jgi:type IV secretion system protein VirB11
LRLEDYQDGGAFAETQRGNIEQRSDSWEAVAGGKDSMILLRSAVSNRKNILISGGTSSGKSTFLNALLREIPAEERLIFIEDTPELQFRHENAVGLIAVRGSLGEADVSAEDLLIASLRLRPDRIILGELRGGEAVTFLRAVNTGHPGSMTTIHADSPIRAIDQLALMVLQTGARLGWEDVVRYVKKSVDIVVQLERHVGRRTISEIAFTSQWRPQ